MIWNIRYRTKTSNIRKLFFALFFDETDEMKLTKLSAASILTPLFL